MTYRTRITLAFLTGYTPFWALGCLFPTPISTLLVFLNTALAAVMLAYCLLEPKEDRLSQSFWDEVAMYLCVGPLAVFMALQVFVDILKGSK